MFKFLVFSCLLTIVIAAVHPPFKVVFQWDNIQYNWPSERAQLEAVARNEYIPANNAIAGIKLWKNQMFLTIPRWKPGVPATLAVTPAIHRVKNNVKISNPALDAYPNWDMQTIDDCNAFQFVQSMEIDPIGRMWVLDTGRTETMTLTPVTKCPPRLVILDLENGGEILRNYVFPEEVAPHNGAYLNDIVLDHEDGGTAFITDNGHEPGIIVYSLKDNKSRKVTHDSMKAETEAVNFVVAGAKVISPVDVDGIALSPPGSERQIYYSPLSSFHLYSVPASVLKNESINDIQNYVRELGRKSSQTDGMVMSNKGVLYFGLLADDAIAMWDTRVNPSFGTGLRVISRDHVLTQWPDTFAFDEYGHLWCVTNSLQNFINNNVNISRSNYRVVRSEVAMKNYQYFENGTAPEIPEIPVIAASAERIDLALSTCLTIVLVFLAR